MDTTTKQRLITKLYSLFGLVLSLASIAVLATLVCTIAAAFVFALAFFLPRNALGAALSAMVHAVRTGSPPGALAAAGLVSSFLIYSAVGAAVLILARLRAGSEWRRPIAWRPWRFLERRRAFWIICACALLYSFAADVAFNYIDPRAGAWLKMPDDPAQAAAIAILAVIFAPVVEELVFRGWIFTRLRQDFGFVSALLVSSAVFAGMHYEATHLYALAVFPIGLALGAIREVTGTIKSTIAFHAFNNLVACVLGFLDTG
ncbi:CPBP family intramembrane glutamic endopeptidase [Methylocapsa palsarum]|uniref:CAAX protease self-immunity n=1 Tax=Methylocapsa palsarum TaxID=1612308 RepID=A0A1I3ZSS6_9HYPH|nr:CPBP family intramembrane glutamic endopeptidase [Methylocapsa palsarum]SFK47135.1 CAAX protease self-immunity [Methylocapsa palsarum]